MTRGVCNQEFADSRIWSRGKGPYHCPKCNFVTPWKDWLKEHNRRSHLP